MVAVVAAAEVAAPVLPAHADRALAACPGLGEACRVSSGSPSCHEVVGGCTSESGSPGPIHGGKIAGILSTKLRGTPS